MSGPRFATAIFCDDVRQEAGNKVSYMGIYEGVLYLPKLPAVLPKLCFVVTACTPPERPFRELLFRVLRDDEVLAEGSIDVAKAQSEPEAQAAAESLVDPKEESRVQIRAVLQLVPLQVASPCRFRVRVLTEEGELKAGSLSVRPAPAASE